MKSGRVADSGAPHMHLRKDPAPWKRTTRTRDGIEYRIRPVCPDDIERERAFILGLSEESRYTRMMGTIREPSAALLQQLVHVDYDRSMTLVAVVGDSAHERIIASAQYAADSSGRGCEFAVAVADAWQGHGVGATLTGALLDYARARGFRRFHGDVLACNNRMIDLVHWLGMTSHSRSDDSALLEVSRPL